MKSHRIQPRGRTGSRGVALIEALIGILIFAFGVLGLMGLQAAMTKAQTSSKIRADAANLASDLMGLIQTDNPGNINSYATASCSGNSRCSDWKAKLAATLPRGAATITVTNSSKVDITITWRQGSEAAGKYQTSMVWQQ